MVAVVAHSSMDSCWIGRAIDTINRGRFGHIVNRPTSATLQLSEKLCATLAPTLCQSRSVIVLAIWNKGDVDVGVQSVMSLCLQKLPWLETDERARRILANFDATLAVPLIIINAKEANTLDTRLVVSRLPWASDKRSLCYGCGTSVDYCCCHCA